MERGNGWGYLSHLSPHGRWNQRQSHQCIGICDQGSRTNGLAKGKGMKYISLGTSDTIIAKMSGAAATTNPTYNTSYVDTTADTFGGGKGSLNGASEQTLVAAPAADQRLVDGIRIYNEDTAAVTVTVQVANGANRYTLGKFTIGVGATLDVLAEIDASYLSTQLAAVTQFTNTTDATSSASGALQSAGGISAAKWMWSGSGYAMNAASGGGTYKLQGAATANNVVVNIPAESSATYTMGLLEVAQTWSGTNTFSGVLASTNATECTSPTAASVTVTGGIGISATSADISGSIYGQYSQITASPASSGTSTVIGMRSDATTASGNNMSGLAGVYSGATHNGAGTISAMYATQSVLSISNSGGGTSTYILRGTSSITGASTWTNAGAASLASTLNNASANVGTYTLGLATTNTLTAGTATTVYGINLGAQNASGLTCTTNIGLNIGAISGGGTTNKAIATSTGLVTFGDTTDTSSSTTGALQCAGGISATKAIFSGSQLFLGTANTNFDTTFKTVSNGDASLALQTGASGASNLVCNAYYASGGWKFNNASTFYAALSQCQATASTSQCQWLESTGTGTAGGTITWGITLRGLRGAVSFPSITTTASSANAFLDSGASNNILRSTSSLQYKTDVETMNADYSANIYKLRPIWYRSLCPADNPQWSWWGLAAEEVYECDPRLVQIGYSADDYETVLNEGGAPNHQVKSGAVKTPQGVAYDRLTTLIIHQLQEQDFVTHNARISAIETEVAELKELVSKLMGNK